MSFVVGVYPGGVAGNDAGGLASGAADDPASVHRALDDLQGAEARLLLVRCYAAFRDDQGPGLTDIAAPLQGESYAVNGRMLDLVLQYQSRSGNVAGYTQFVRNAICRYGAITQSVQITEEPNVTGNATLDGDYPDVLRAIVAGVHAAALAVRELGFDHVRIAGEPERELRAKRSRDGIPVDGTTWQEILRAADKVKLARSRVEDLARGK